MKSSFLRLPRPAFSSVLLLITFIIPFTLGAAPVPSNDHYTEVFDKTCKHTAKSLYELPGPPGESWESIKSTSLFKHDEGQLASYVGYPCNVALFNEYLANFVLPGLRCPFSGDLETKFRKFIEEKLIPLDQVSPPDDPVSNRNTTDTSLLFQYICFSPQFERCKPVSTTGNVTGSCDGVCECMDSVPIDSKTGYPNISGLTEATSKPVVQKENDIRCGVRVGGLCVPTWDRTCKPGGAGYNETLEKHYKLKDFYFKCEANAGCHNDKRVCQCAEGHKCGDGASKLAGKMSTVEAVMWAWALVIFNRVVDKVL